MKIVLIGAGSAQFGLGMLGDIFLSEVLEGTEICLMDINPETLEQVAQKARKYIKQKELSFTITSTTDRKVAVKNSDFVVISIEVGDRFALWDMDWSIPQQYGISQVYGENGGAGGVFHSLRIIPPILEICEDINQLSPDSYVFCYTNPMTAITTTVLRKYPELNFIGMCHEIASIPRYLPTLLNTAIENISYRAAGLNHFSVMLEASYKDTGLDAYQDVMDRAPAFFEKEPGYSEILKYYEETGNIIETEGVVERKILERNRDVRSWSDRNLFHFIMENFGLFPITVDSHLGEYISWAHEIADHRGIKDFYSYYRIMLSEPEKAEITGESHERVVPIIEGILNNHQYEEPAVNIMNNGLIPTLPRDIAVEVPAVIGKDGIKGIEFPEYPRGFAALLRNYCGVYDMTAQAVLTESRDAVIQALLVNPVINTCRNIPDLVDHMIDRQKKWLGYLK